jgi:hypothetical protein
MGIANWWESRIGAAVVGAADAVGEESHGNAAAVEHGDGNGSAAGNGIGGPGQQAEQMEVLDPAAMSMEFLDDVWMRDLLAGEYDYTFESFL